MSSTLAQPFYKFPTDIGLEQSVNGIYHQIIDRESILAVENMYGIRYYGLMEDESGSRYQLMQNLLTLNTEGQVDLKRINPENSPQVDVLCLTDVDQDGKNDLVVRENDRIFWMRCLEDGLFAPRLEMAKNVPLNYEFQLLTNGLLVFSDIYKSFHQIILVDYRKGADGIDVQRTKFPYTSCIGFYEQAHQWYVWTFQEGEGLQLLPFANPKKSQHFKTDDFQGDILLTDFNQDGFQDLVHCDGLDIRVFRGNAEGQFTKGENLLEPIDNAFLQQLMKWQEPNDFERLEEDNKAQSLDWLSNGSLRVVDFNADGYPDLLYRQEYFVAFINESGKTFRKEFMGGPYDPDEYYFTDLNGDGRLEFLIDAFSGQYLLQMEGEHFEETLLSEKGYENGFSVADVDQDGDNDVLIFSESGALQWSENKEGRFQPAQFLRH